MMTLNRLLLVGGMMIGLWLIVPAASAQERYPLTVQPTPADSQVRILNSRLSYQPGIRLPPAVYHLEIRHEDYQTVTQAVHLRNQPLTVAVRLPPLESQVTVQPAKPELPTAAVTSRTKAAAPREDESRAADAVLAAALQSGDLQLWQVIFATPPPNTKWLAALRASPIYWLLSPLTFVAAADMAGCAQL